MSRIVSESGSDFSETYRYTYLFIVRITCSFFGFQGAISLYFNGCTTHTPIMVLNLHDSIILVTNRYIQSPEISRDLFPG